MPEQLNYAVEQRLRLIDFLLLKYGIIGREEICAFFGVGSSQATRDLRLYKERRRDNCQYDPTVRRYRKTEMFLPLFNWSN